MRPFFGLSFAAVAAKHQASYPMFPRNEDRDQP